MERNSVINKDVYTILVVDDVKSICNSIRRELGLGTRDRKDVYFKVVDEQDPEIALKKVYEINPDLIITDIKMPYLSGDKLVTELKKIFPKMPIVVITGFATKENILAVYKADPKIQVFSKPWDEEKFLQSILQLLKIPPIDPSKNKGDG
jgi:CheY-like chemotaxis protein